MPQVQYFKGGTYAFIHVPKTRLYTCDGKIQEIFSQVARDYLFHPGYYPVCHLSPFILLTPL